MMRKIKLNSTVWLEIIRVAVGLIWLYSGVSKVMNPTFDLVKTVQYFASNNPYPFYQSFINNVVVTNGNLFSVLVPYGEIVIGLLLTLGLLTKLSSFFGVVMNANFFLAAAWTGSSTATLNLLMIVLQIAFFFSITKYLSIQNYLFRR